MLEELEPKIVALQLEPKYGKFAIEPLECGFGHTLGNAFRRVLLAHLEGAAITDVRIEGVVQEFTTLDGVIEDSKKVEPPQKATENPRHRIAKAQQNQPIEPEPEPEQQSAEPIQEHEQEHPESAEEGELWTLVALDSGEVIGEWPTAGGYVSGFLLAWDKLFPADRAQFLMANLEMVQAAVPVADNKTAAAELEGILGTANLAAG